MHPATNGNLWVALPRLELFTAQTNRRMSLRIRQDERTELNCIEIFPTDDCGLLMVLTNVCMQSAQGADESVKTNPIGVYGLNATPAVPMISRSTRIPLGVRTASALARKRSGDWAGKNCVDVCQFNCDTGYPILTQYTLKYSRARFDDHCVIRFSAFGL